MVSETTLDLVAFEKRAQSYVAWKRMPVDAREDVVQEMVMDVLEHPQSAQKLDFIYRHALDRVFPRRMVRGRCLRDYKRVVPLSAQRSARIKSRVRSPEAVLLEAEGARLCLAGLSGNDAWLLIWYAVDGHTMRAIAEALGCTEGRICQRLSAIRRH